MKEEKKKGMETIPVPREMLVKIEELLNLARSCAFWQNIPVFYGKYNNDDEALGAIRERHREILDATFEIRKMLAQY